MGKNGNLKTPTDEYEKIRTKKSAKKFHFHADLRAGKSRNWNNKKMFFGVSFCCFEIRRRGCRKAKGSAFLLTLYTY